MRPALQRLLARPSSLELLRYLTGTATYDTIARYGLRTQTVRLRRCPLCRNYETVAEGAARAGESDKQDDEGVEQSRFLPTLRKVDKKAIQHRPLDVHISPEWPNLLAIRELSTDVNWEDTLTSEQLEFESDLDSEPGELKQLVDHPALRDDMTLWLCLLHFRWRRYGDAGVITVWDAIGRRGIQLPVGHNGEKLWAAFLDVGFKNQNLMDKVVAYSERLHDSTGNGWPRLYPFIMQHFLITGDTVEVIRWHKRLVKRFAPSSAHFLNLVHNVLHYGGNLEAFKEVYIRSAHRNIYSALIPELLAREDFDAALSWHYFLLKHKDIPTNAKIVAPLVNHFAIYNRKIARIVTQSLVNSGVSFAPSVPIDLTGNKKISREMMNLMHGEVHSIGPKKYNDSLGARWFATSWVSLDIAISAVHALGVQAIGPLSVQAIALREKTASEVTQRLDQLKELGISPGDSVFVKALKSFARNRDENNLTALLESDQHPESLDDVKLQESLLVQYEETGDWVKYRHTLAVLSAVSDHPVVTEFNLVLRNYASKNHRTGILRTLEEMRTRGIEVHFKTINILLHSILRSRRPGRQVVSHNVAPDQKKDIELTISILKRILESNGAVPLTCWAEIIRRLGMLGRLEELERLCVWLAAWYKPNSTLRAESTGLSSPRLPNRDWDHVPSQVPTSHPLHPLRLLFPDSLQMAILDWGFIYENLRAGVRSSQGAGAGAGAGEETLNHSNSPPKYTRGIRLLHLLRDQQVAINGIQVRRAIYNRLMTVFGPRQSDKKRNRQIAETIVHFGITFEQVVQGFDRAWGGKVFPDMVELERQIRNGEKMSLRGMQEKARLTGTYGEHDVEAEVKENSK